MMAHDPVTAGIDLVKTFVGKFVKDKDLASKLEAASESEEFQGELKLLYGQIEINILEAQSGSLFIGGWRPATGWTCCFALAYSTIIAPFLAIWFTVPEVDTALLYPVLLGMLGLSSTRSFEKVKGVAKEKK